MITLEGVGKCLRKNWQPLPFRTVFFKVCAVYQWNQSDSKNMFVHCWGVSISQLTAMLSSRWGMKGKALTLVLALQLALPSPGEVWGNFGLCVFHGGLGFFPNLTWELVITMNVQLSLLCVAAKWSVEFWRRWLLIIMTVSPRVDLLLPILAT